MVCLAEGDHPDSCAEPAQMSQLLLALHVLHVEERTLMAVQQEHCADKLLMVAEMLEAASEYLTACRGLSDDEDPIMSRLAYEHLLTLKNQLGQLNRKIDALETDLRRRIIAAREVGRDRSDETRDRAEYRVTHKSKGTRGGTL